MARHRNVRSMNYQDEYDGYDDVFGHSVEDDYCVSPGTAAQFTYDRGRMHEFGSYMEREEIPEEDSEFVEDQDSLHDSGGSNYSQPQLSDIEQAKLNSCLEGLRSIVGETCPERLLIKACIAADFNLDIAANTVLNQQDAPKPQREKKERKYRDLQDDLDKHPFFPHFAVLPSEIKQQLPVAPPPGFQHLAKVQDKTDSSTPVCQSSENKENLVQCPAVESGRQHISLASIAKQHSDRKGKAPSREVLPPGITSSRSDGVPGNPPKAAVSLSALAAQHNLQHEGSPSPKQYALPHKDSMSSKRNLQQSKNISGVQGKPITLSEAAQKANSTQERKIGPADSEAAKPTTSSFSLSALAAAHQLDAYSTFDPQPSRVGLKEVGGVTTKTVPQGGGFISLADLASQHGRTSAEGSGSLSELAGKTKELQTVSLSALAKDGDVSQPKQKMDGGPSLGDLAAGFKAPSMSLAELAAQHKTKMSNTPPKAASVISSPLTSSKFSLAALAAQHSVGKTGTPPSSSSSPKVSLSELAAQQSKSGNSEAAKVVSSKDSNSSKSTFGFHVPPSISRKTASDSDAAGVSKAHTAGRTSVLPPPGFQSVQAIDLSDLAARHPTVSKTTMRGLLPDKNVTSHPAEGAKQPPSNTMRTSCAAVTWSSFGAALCTTHSKISVGQPKHHKFAFVKQSSHLPAPSPIPQHIIVPFAFTTPSPDDIVKQKQRAAFTRGDGDIIFKSGSKGSASSNQPNAENPKRPAPTVVIPPAVATGVTAATEPNLAQGIARLTFTSGNKTVSGFTPEKQAQSPFKAKNHEDIDKAKRTLDMDVGTDKTPRRNASMVDLVKKGAEGDGSPHMSRNASAADLTKPEAKLSRNKLDKAAVMKEYEKRKAESKDCINLVVIGHVDAGKSTLMGHVLYQLGFVNKKTMHKYEQESKKLGKASFAYAWVLDETEEERSRGVTMDIAQSHFETDTKLVRLLDAPGHKDFIPNMITGAAQADVAVLVVNATKGEFETGFDAGGQTREHAMLIRSLGVSQLAVAVNKMDTVDWAKTRFDDIVRKLKQFLKQAGFRENDVTYIPCSGLLGDNLVNSSTNPDVSSWYTGPTLVLQIDKFTPPDRPIDKPFRMCIADVFKGMGSGFSVSGMIQAGCVQPGDRLQCMPQAHPANVKSVLIDDSPVPVGFAGDNAVLTVTGIDMTDVSVGSIMCDPSSPIKSTSRLKARVVIFNIDLPITKGFPVVFHYQSMSEPARVRKLISQLNKSTGDVIRNKPRCLTKNTSAMIELEIDRPVCIELYKDFKDLGRFMLRYSGSTIAAGLVTEIVNAKAQRTE